MYVCVWVREIIGDKSFENIFIATYIYTPEESSSTSLLPF